MPDLGDLDEDFEFFRQADRFPQFALRRHPRPALLQAIRPAPEQGNPQAPKQSLLGLFKVPQQVGEMQPAR